MKLVIVESPAKAKTIERFLGPGYKVAASNGHIRDLPRNAKNGPKMAVDVDNGYKPIYVVPEENKQQVRRLRQLLKGADEVVLATDEDREGEAIGWHLLEILKPKVPVRRIGFNEITKSAVARALENPREVNRQLVHAQEARRILDRLFGFELSPVLWKKVHGGLSAGRVQSVALRLVVEREEERKRFQVAEFWSARAELTDGDLEFGASLIRIGERPVAVSKDFDPNTGRLREGSDAIALGKDRAGEVASSALTHTPWRVARVVRQSKRRRPPPPFTTSTLQQAASSHLRMSPKATMRVAQDLYQGVDLGGGEREGLITYMRTDSVALSSKALGDARDHILEVWGERYHDGPRRYKSKSKRAQEAHEAIRPSEISRTPDSLTGVLGRDQLRLYRLIWNRTVASQMTDAQVEQTSADIVATAGSEHYTFRARGSVLRFPGFLKLYRDASKDQHLPALKEGDQVYLAEGGAEGGVRLLAVNPQREETKPPGRFSEAALIKKLEEAGIGRPSTYSPTISRIQEKGYVRKRRGALVPSYVGVAVIRLLRNHFDRYIDVGFTARMEDSLDVIAAGDMESSQFLEAFYRGTGDNAGLEQETERALPSIEKATIPIGEHPDTGQEIVVRFGRFGAYLSCGEGAEGSTATVPDDVMADELTPQRAAEILKAQSVRDRHLGVDPANGEPIYVRTGPYGPYVQRGEITKGRPKKGEQGPKRMGLPKEINPAEVTHAAALKFLELPRPLGEDPTNGEPVTASVNNIGAFVKRSREYRNLASWDEVFTVTLERALALLNAKAKGLVLKDLGKHPESGQEIVVVKGRYGPYVTDGKVNRTLPKGKDPADVTIDDAVQLLSTPRGSKKRRKQRK